MAVGGWRLAARLILALALVGLQARGAAAQTRGLSLRPVTQMLGWYPTPEEGGAYTAELLGFYRDAGLHERIVPYDPDADLGARLDRGSITFGMMAADTLLADRARGLHLVAVLATMQISPRAILWHAGEDIHSLADLGGHTIINANGEAWWRYLQQRYRYAHVGELAGGDDVAAFLRLPDGVLGGSSTDDPYLVHLKGQDARWELVADAGWDPYPGLVVTSEAMIRDHPDTVRAFVAATLRGWDAYLRDPALTLGLLQSFPGADRRPLTPDAMRYAFQQLRPLVIGGDALRSGLGTMSEARFAGLAAQLASLGIVRGPIDPRAAFTLAFLPR
jgi:NitT/TauT family transport system substrate-binding protein